MEQFHGMSNTLQGSCLHLAHELYKSCCCCCRGKITYLKTQKWIVHFTARTILLLLFFALGCFLFVSLLHRSRQSNGGVSMFALSIAPIIENIFACTYMANAMCCAVLDTITNNYYRQPHHIHHNWGVDFGMDLQSKSADNFHSKWFRALQTKYKALSIIMFWWSQYFLRVSLYFLCLFYKLIKLLIRTAFFTLRNAQIRERVYVYVCIWRKTVRKSMFMCNVMWKWIRNQCSFFATAVASSINWSIDEIALL